MREIRRVSRFIRRNAASIQAALAFRGFLHLPKSRFAKNLAEITEIERGPMLSIAENEIGKSAAERIEVMWEGIIEPIAAFLSIGCNRALQARNDEPDAAAVLQHTPTFPKKPLELIRIEVLEHMRRINRGNGV